MIRVDLIPTTETTWGLADRYNLYYEGTDIIYKEDLLSEEVMDMEEKREIEIILDRKYL